MHKVDGLRSKGRAPSSVLDTGGIIEISEGHSRIDLAIGKGVAVTVIR